MATKKTVRTARPTKSAKPKKQLANEAPVVDAVIEQMPSVQPSARFMPRAGVYLAGFLTALVLFAVSTWLAVQHKGMTGWEISFFHLINDMPDGLRIVGLIATITPESTLIGAVAVVAAFLFKKYRLSWRLALGVLGGYAVTAVGKYLVDRPRPAEIIADVQLRAHDTGMGFPSGHTMLMTVLTLMLVPYVPGKWKLLLPLPIILMAWSRIYLGLHAPLDVIGGFAIGLGVVCFLRILPTAIARLCRVD